MCSGRDKGSCFSGFVVVEVMFSVWVTLEGYQCMTMLLPLRQYFPKYISLTFPMALLVNTKFKDKKLAITGMGGWVGYCWQVHPFRFRKLYYYIYCAVFNIFRHNNIRLLECLLCIKNTWSQKAHVNLYPNYLNFN